MFGSCSATRSPGPIPAGCQVRREPIGGLVELAVGQLAAVEHRDRLVRCGVRAFAEDDGKVEAHGPS